METVGKILDEAKSKTGSDYATAMLLGVERQHVSGWRSGRSKPSAICMAKLSEITGRDLSAIVAIVNSEKAEGAEKEFWENFVKRLGGIAAGFLFAVNLIMTPTPSEAAPVLNLKGQVCILCKMRRVRQWLEQLKLAAVKIKSSLRFPVVGVGQITA